ncbi:glycolipid transfer protein domain-containing protein 2 isoform X2 [Electrophorus electricus]|uniref:glycolipid transfer protein domain-containing protein 2 isoform X2 n=1 Tax=Electrophorus electricus TaxID=8005 RepID=UPI0015D0253E|nr:glycolipid transfer protein domain-containing protein 2 isoform X2 [Electrophorus electricus]
MGVKGLAAFTIIFIIALFCYMWLYGALDQQWQYCLKVYIAKDQSPSLLGRNSSENNVLTPLRVCPGQKFQAGDLLKHLQAAPVLANDVLLKPYLASWDELIKFLKTLGPIMGLVSQEIESKTSIIRKLAQKEEEDIKRLLRERQSEAGQVSGSSLPLGEPFPNSYSKLPGGAEGGAYVSVRSMMEAELARGLVDFTQLTVSGCRTLLRLHRALLWLQLFLQSLADEDEGGCSPAQLCRDTYRLTLAQHHTFWVKQAAELAFKAMPERAFFHRLVCAKTPVETVIILHMVSGAIGEVYNRTQLALEEHGMLALP